MPFQLPILEEDEDSRVEEIHLQAGRIIRMSDSLHEKYRRIFGASREMGLDVEGDVDMDEVEGDHTYAPFASELDWRIAKWAVEDGPGHNAFNRLLDIPGVCYLIIVTF